MTGSCAVGPGQQLVERRIAVAAACRGRLRERDVLVQRRVLVAGGGLDRGDDLARDAELGEVAEARLAVGAVVAHRLVEPDEALLDEVVRVAADQEVRRGLEPHEAVVALDDAVVGVLAALLGERDQVVIIKLDFTLRLCPLRRIGAPGRRAGTGSAGEVAERAIECSSPAQSGPLKLGGARTSPGAPGFCSRSLKLDYSLISGAAVWVSYESLSRPLRRNCKIPYTSAAAAVETLSEPTFPRIGSDDELVAGLRHARAQPASLRAEHQHHPPAVVGAVVGHARVGGGAVDPGLAPLGLRRASRPGCARARSRRCSTAPAEALQTAGVTSAERRSGSTTPAQPGRLGHAADRAEVVRVLHLVEAQHERVVGLQQRVGVRVRVGLDLGADALVVGRAAALLELVRPRRRRTSTSPSHTSRAARSVA